MPVSMPLHISFFINNWKVNQLKNGKLLVLDVSSYIFRAYYAMPPLTNPKGEPVNAVLGFINMFLSLADTFGEFKLVAALDSGKEKTKRKELYDNYKANRKVLDEELVVQLRKINPMLEAMGIPFCGIEGYEADDIIASYVKKYKDTHEVYVVSSDKDLMQLVEDGVFLYDSMKKKVFDRDAVKEKFDVTPEQIRDLLALMGDSSDNIPGVPGIGPKTASKLLNEYGTFDGIYHHLGELSKGQQQKFAENREIALLSKELVSLESNIELDVEPTLWENVSEEKFPAFAIENGFKKLIEKLGIKESYDLVIPSEGKIDYNSEEICFVKEGDKYYFSDGKNYSEALISDFTDKTMLYGFNIKDSVSTFHVFKGKVRDLQIAFYITDAGRHGYTLEDVASALNIFAGKIEGIENILAVLNGIKTKIKSIYRKESKFEHLLDEIEMKNLYVIKEMENYGMPVDTDAVKELKEDFSLKLKEIEEKIYAYTGEFNINSPKQLGEILFEKLGLPSGKKKKTGYSTDQSVLESLKELHPVPEFVLEHRTYSKLLSTYVDPILEKTDSEGKLHTTFIVTHAATGRLASRDPNLQNIPVRGEEGKKIREVFKAPEGKLFISLDYSQIELRILAMLSKDEELIEAFRNNEDIHTKTASAIFNVFPGFVDAEMRRHAKAVNFGIIYGMQAFKLSQDTGVQIAFAKKYIENYFAFYKGVKKFIDSVIETAKEKGYSETIFGRRRYLPELSSTNKIVLRQAERMAVNTAIQGSAADIIKIGAAKIYERIEKDSLDAKLLLQVHDELIIETSEEKSEEYAAIFENIMKNNIGEFEVPLDVNSSIGKTWGELK